MSNKNKNIFYLSFLTVVCLMGSNAAWTQDSALKLLGTGGNLCAFSVAAFGDELALAGTFNNGGDHNLFISLNRDGSIQDAVGFLVPNELASGTARLIPTGDGGYLMAGGVATSGIFDGLVLRLNDSGNVVWAKIFGTTGTDQFLDAVKVADGFVLVGEIEGGAGADILILKLSKTGKVLFRKVYGNPGRDLPLSIAETSDQGLLVTAAVHESDDNSPARGIVLKLNKRGKLLWSRDIGPTNASFLAGMFATEMADKTLALINYSINPGNGRGRILFSKMTSDGSMISSRALSTGGASLIPFTSIKTTDEGILISGYLFTQAPTPTAQSQRGFLMKINSAGKVLWRKRLTLPNDPNLLFAGTETSTEYVTTGCSAFGNPQQISLIKVDQTGAPLSACSLIRSVPVRSAKISLSAVNFPLPLRRVPVSVSSTTIATQPITVQQTDPCP